MEGNANEEHTMKFSFIMQGVIHCSGYSLLLGRPNFDECCSCIYEARIAGVKKMTGHLALSRDKKNQSAEGLGIKRTSD